ncbi:MAG: metal ABC transporter substrate-binding protein [Actinomycetota bacterium]|nr:metal ABC transporter substrate-binding protein [Actinomycetota bacterium]
MSHKRLWLALVVLLVTLLALGAGCGASRSGGEGAAGETEVRVSATISVIGDLVEEVGGERVEVETIVPVGGSPETFQPSPSDAQKISESRVVFQNGLGLEGWLDDLLRSAGGEEVRVVELAEGLETIEDGDEHRHEEEGEHAGEEHAEGNPHLWLDVSNAQRYVERIRDTLVEVDPDGAGEYRANAEEYLAELEELDRHIRDRAGEVPEENRKLVTFHEAFPYFAEAYGFEQVGVILRNPDAEPSSREVAEVIRTVREEDVPAIFTEPQFNAGLADTIAQEAGVEVYELYSDTLSDTEVAGSYEEMMRTNIDRIVEALG